MGKLLGIFMGPAGGWIAFGLAACLLAAGGSAGYLVKGVIDGKAVAEAQRDTEKCNARHEKARANSAEQAAAALAESATNVSVAMNALAAKALARGKTLDQFLKEIANAPPSKVCGAVASELALRRSVQPVPAK